MIRPFTFASIFLHVAAPLLAQQLAFPGAEGGGMYTQGGRGGKVIEVTNLNDSGEGSLRAAILQTGPRTVIFRVSGTITLASRLEIKSDSITIAGQTAPGDGICIRKYPLYVRANHVIIRYLRFRLGDESGGEDDAITGIDYRHYVIIDHCSASWSVDETLSFYNMDSLTVQWCLVSESLYNSNHPKGSHGYGGIWGGRNSTFHHNLLAHHSSRNPRFSGLGTTVVSYNLDFRNNVIYNWGFNSAYGGEAGTFNMVGNYFKYGPATKSGVKYRILEPSDSVARWYISDNYVDGNPTISANNWNGGIQGTYASKPSIKMVVPFAFAPVYTQSAVQAYEAVLASAGACLPKRDTVDARVVYETRMRTATYDGKTYEIKQGLDTSVVRGIIDTQNDVGGWPVLVSTAPPADTDHDGMPDEWELAHRLNPNNPEDRNVVGFSGYTKLEEYLNELAGTPTMVRTGTELPTKIELLQNFPNPFNPKTEIRYWVLGVRDVRISIYDLLGREVAVLVDEKQDAGSYRVQWDASRFSSGVYVCMLISGEHRAVKKMSLIR